MKERLDLVRGWFRKGDSDLIALDASMAAGALDAACFHAQQAAEKYLKAFLLFSGTEFPFTHNLVKLVELCADTEPVFQVLIPIVEPLTPYAVELRYDAEFWPSGQDAQEARAAAIDVKQFVSQFVSLHKMGNE